MAPHSLDQTLLHNTIEKPLLKTHIRVQRNMPSLIKPKTSLRGHFIICKGHTDKSFNKALLT